MVRRSTRATSTALTALSSVTALILLSGCEEAKSAAISPASPSSSGAAASSPPNSSTSSSPASSVAKPAPPTERADVPVASSCGTVTAASGLTLQVIGNQASGIDCTEAKRIISDFHQSINGRQSADSTEATSSTVDGWLCVSGAPSAQGGTTCSAKDKMIFAAVVPVE